MTEMRSHVVSAVRRTCGELGLRAALVSPDGEAASGGLVASCYPLRADGRAADGTKRTLRLLVKSASADPVARRYVPITQMTLREVQFYEKIAPTFDGLIDDPLVKIRLPHCYCTSVEYTKEFIVMENLKSAGFVLIKQEIPLDYIHASSALRALARFHGHTLVWEARDSRGYREATALLGDNFTVSSGEYDAEGFCRYAFHAANKFFSALDNELYREKIKSICENVIENYRLLAESGHVKVISHMDYWINNVMFKYGNSEDAPMEAAVIDFQMVRRCSIANDLLSFFGTCFDVDLRRAHYHRLLTDYYDQLTRTVEAGGCSLRDICSWDVLRQEIKSQASFGISMAILQVQFFDEAPIDDLTILYSGLLPESFFHISTTYRKLVNDLVEDFVSWELL